MASTVAWEIVRRAADGDARAQHDLVEATVDGLWSLALRLTRRRDEADDIVQETYTRVFATISTLAPTGRFEGYLARTATHLVLERWRRRRPRAELHEAIAAPDALEPWQTVAQREDDQRRLAAIWAAIGHLEPHPRAALLLFYAQNLSCEEIGRILDAPVGTVKTWLHRARNQVRQIAESLLKTEPAASRAANEGAL
jgi:RNA polymerase sigma-70 factor (ECF subfamily)